ncbi:hypothetical protein [Streptomyces sp. KL116D]|uniref:hypothetical protein n=1 Tax=Streptomyces sp. KL116D TaxID=3045152 RepID=UPI0035573B6B
MYEVQSPPGGVPAAYALPEPPREPDTLVTRQAHPGPADRRRRPRPRTSRSSPAQRRRGRRRALLAAVLGTVVTLGAVEQTTGDRPTGRHEPVGVGGGERRGLGADKADQGGGGGSSSSKPTDPGQDIPGTADGRRIDRLQR